MYKNVNDLEKNNLSKRLSFLAKIKKNAYSYNEYMHLNMDILEALRMHLISLSLDPNIKIYNRLLLEYLDKYNFIDLEQDEIEEIINNTCYSNYLENNFLHLLNAPNIHITHIEPYILSIINGKNDFEYLNVFERELINEIDYIISSIKSEMYEHYKIENINISDEEEELIWSDINNSIFDNMEEILENCFLYESNIILVSINKSTLPKDILKDIYNYLFKNNWEYFNNCVFYNEESNDICIVLSSETSSSNFILLLTLCFLENNKNNLFLEKY